MPGKRKPNPTSTSKRKKAVHQVNLQAIVPASAKSTSTTANLIPFLHQPNMRQIEDSLQRALVYLHSFAPTLFTRIRQVAGVVNHSIVEVYDVISYLKPLLLPYHQEEFSLEYSDKAPRDVTSFEDNIVSSVALPDRVTIYSPKVHSPSNESKGYGSRILNLFMKAPTPVAITSAPTNSVPLSTSATTPSVRSILEMLQAKIETLTDPKEIDKLELQRVELLAEEIKEHAARRVDSFFYLILAVYRQEVEVKNSSTEKQHGQGSAKARTDGCHDSLIKNVELIPLNKNVEVKSFSKKHFEDVLNMVMELPKVVNLFDIYLERVKNAKVTNYCFEILNKLARNKLEPRQAMALFFKAMDRYFVHFEKRVRINKNGKIKYPLALLKILEYQKEGTFWAANADLTLRDKYLHMMLRAKPGLFSTLRYHYQKIQNEIFTSPPTEPEPEVRRRLKKG